MSDDAIPFWSGATEWAEDRDEIHAAIDRVGGDGRWIFGPAVEALEHQLAASLGGGVGAVSLASGTDALRCALRAVGVRPGDRVVVPALVPVPVAAAVVAEGAIPSYIDICPRSLQIDYTDEMPTMRAAAIIHVHLYGRCAEIPITHVPIVEDCAQAFGASVDGRYAGTMGTVAVTSFYPTKPLGGLGDGGALMSGDPRIMEAARRWRHYGYDGSRRHWSVEFGTNSRTDALHAAALLVRLSKHRARLAQRAQIAAWYDEQLHHGLVQAPRLAEGEHSAWYQYPIVLRPDMPETLVRCAKFRDAVRAAMQAFGVETVAAYEYLPAQMAPWRGDYRPGDCPVAERIAASVLSLPLWIGMTGSHVARVVDALHRALMGAANAGANA